MIKIRFLYFFTFISISIFAQNSSRVFKDVKEINNGVEIFVNDGTYRIQFYNNKIIETSFVPKGEELTKTSHSVVLQKENLEILSPLQEGKSVFSVGDLSVHIQHKPFQISYWFQGEEIISEKKGYYKSKHEPLDLVKGNIQYEETEKIEFNLSDSEVLYGGGARALGMNRRGHRLPLYNRAQYGYETYAPLMNFTIPLVISSKKYMIHFDNPAIGYLDLDSKKDNSLTYETISGRKIYQIVVGDSWEELIDNYTNLTGKQPMIPRWALGNFSSRFGYHSQQETEETIQKFKEENIPVDAVILDLYWFGKEVKGTMGNLEVDKDSFPNMKKMITDFHKKGIKTVLITEPFVVDTSKRWEETVSQNILAKDSINQPAKYQFYFGNTGIIDIYKKESRSWLWNIYEGLLDLGVKGFWGDLGEPEVLPSWVYFGDTNQIKADEIHNIYGHDWAKLIYEGYQNIYPNERPFILMRAGYSGSQRFGMIPWSGDVNRTWGGLQSQPEIALQMGLQGLGYMHSDLGGFAGANLDDNLYVRWLQYGVFQPIFRPHAQEDVPSEPVFRSDFAKKHAKKAIELRYRLLPYNYNLTFENHTKGLPLMRPLFFLDDKLNKTSSTYLWGNDILVTPILKDRVKEKEVIFPKNYNWFNFYTNKKISGNQTLKVDVDINSIPVYIKGGAFITMTPLVQTTDNYDGNQLEVHYYFDDTVKESESTLYNDDGITANTFEKGAFELLEFEAEIEKRYLEIDFEAEFGKNWNPQKKDIKLVVHNISWNPKKIKVNGKRLRIMSENNRLVIPFLWNIKKELKIKISLK